MTRLLAMLAALAAVLATAPAAFALQYTVNDPGDAPDALIDAVCDSDTATAGDQCTLRAAIQEANATALVADTIAFTGAGTAPAPLTALDPVTSQLTIDGGGATTVTFDAAAAGPLVSVQAANSTLRAITITGGASGNAVDLTGGGDRLDTVTVRNTPGTGVRAAGSGVRIDATRVDSTGGTGIVVSGSNVTIAGPTITRTGGPGIDVGAGAATITSSNISAGSAEGIRLSGDGAAVGNGRIHANTGNGVTITGQNNTVSRVIFYANGGKPIGNGPVANGGMAPPQNLRIGPRRADGSLPLTGTSSPGTIELWTGDMSLAAEPGFVDAFGVSGDFTYGFASEPAPGTAFAASVSGGTGSSEFATVSVPNDVASPTVLSSRALDPQNVRIDASEPLDPSSVQKEDFSLTMAGLARPVQSVSVSPDGSFVTLTSSGWKAGEAGYVELTGAGVLADAAGNATMTAPRLRVLAAPGDFAAPLGAKLAITPTTICLTRGRSCRKPGMAIKFVSTEPGKATVVVKRGNVQIGKRLYGNIVAGPNTLKFNGRLGARKLRAGRYRLLLYLQDVVQNVTDQPPIQLFTVRRVTK